MTRLVDHQIRRLAEEQSMIFPFWERTQDPESGMSYGLSVRGYDIRLGEDVNLIDKALTYSLEYVKIPDWLDGAVEDKSSYLRQFTLVGHGILEPGWEGHIVLELLNFGEPKLLKKGTPIAQISFTKLDTIPEKLYTGKYQKQGAEPVPFLRYDESKHGS